MMDFRLQRVHGQHCGVVWIKIDRDVAQGKGSEGRQAEALQWQRWFDNYRIRRGTYSKMYRGDANNSAALRLPNKEHREGQ